MVWAHRTIAHVRRVVGHIGRSRSLCSPSRAPRDGLRAHGPDSSGDAKTLRPVTSFTRVLIGGSLRHTILGFASLIFTDVGTTTTTTTTTTTGTTPITTTTTTRDLLYINFWKGITTIDFLGNRLAISLPGLLLAAIYNRSIGWASHSLAYPGFIRPIGGLLLCFSQLCVSNICVNSISAYIFNKLQREGKTSENADGTHTLTWKWPGLYEGHILQIKGKTWCLRNLVYSIPNRADVLRDLERYDEAEPLFRERLARAEAELGADHSDTIGEVHNLAGILCYQEKFAEAEPLLRRALVGDEVALGKDHPDTLNTITGLARVLDAQGKHTEAARLYRRALAGMEVALGADHFRTRMTVAWLANTLQNQGKYEEAEPLFRRLLAGQEAALGADHRDTLLTASCLAVVLDAQGKRAEAAPLCARVRKGGLFGPPEQYSE